jgi:hypothetical protein
MSNQNLPILPPTLPEGYCWPDNPQTFVNDTVGKAVAQFVGSGFSVVLAQNTTPATADRDKLWFNTATTHLLYWNSSLSSWVAAHPEEPSSDKRALFVGLAADVDTLDDGASGAVSALSGPFWEIDTAFAGRSPMGPGVISGSTPSKTLDVAENFGEGSHTQVVAELAAHTHDVVLDGGGNDGSAKVWTAVTDNAVTLTYTSSSTGSSTPMNVTHPVRGAYVIKRTARIYYVS